MVPEKDLKKFASQYEENIQELLVLTAEGVGGAGSWGNGLWQPSCRLLAYIDLADGRLHGGLNQQESVLNWLVSDDECKNWRFGLQALTIYRIKARSLKGKLAGSYFMLLEVLERLETHSQFDPIRQAYLQPVTLTDEALPGVCFELDREFDWFNAEIAWLGQPCKVYLETAADNQEDATAALAAFKQFYADLSPWDAKLRAFAAAQLTQNANDWQEDCAPEDEFAPITKEDFARRIDVCEFNIDEEGDFTAYFDDDDMFFDHSILVEGNINGELSDAYLAG